MVSMPAVVVLIVCKTIALPYASPIDEANASYTRHEPREFAVENGKMQCRRVEVQVYDQAEANGAAPQPFNLQRCQMSSIMLGASWNASHRTWKWWRSACPVPIIDTETGAVLDYKLPECGRRDIVECLVDTEI